MFAASHQGIAHRTGGASTNGGVIHDSAVGADAASPAAAGVFASEVVATAVRRAIVVGLAFTSVTRDQRVTDVTRRASTNGSIVAAAVKSRLASGVGAARAGLAQILLGELTARDEGISSETSGARADGLMALDLAVGAGTTDLLGLVTRVLTTELDAGLLVAAIIMTNTLRVAS